MRFKLPLDQANSKAKELQSFSFYLSHNICTNMLVATSALATPPQCSIASTNALLLLWCNNKFTFPSNGRDHSQMCKACCCLQSENNKAKDKFSDRL